MATQLLTRSTPAPRDAAGTGRKDAGIVRLILVNGAPASGKSTLARRYVDDHDQAVLVEVDTLRMTLPNWEQDEATRLVPRPGGRGGRRAPRRRA
jgi:chloramphenicol 3-O-phosphotransferase